MLIGRAECFLVGLPDIELTVTRLKAYAAAGADCLYAPGIKTAAHIRAVVDAVHPKPVNLLVGGPERSLARANRRTGRAPRERRRRSGARGLGRIHERGPRDRGAGKFRRPRRRGDSPGDERAVRQQRPLVAGGMGDSQFVCLRYPDP